ncbi:hypothetical protein THRCLA_02860 [Thraustotheca clavata]|uniref:RAVE complex protein Rav1 C-terminal domain-containing protein n=1 Tax=Thraustotheca clavata TaxID=74557 RepID=A0A1W0A3T2_9STRA|nr:hypothetical protein THRCLA_02860 [Thraustotheca clavata]
MLEEEIICAGGVSLCPSLMALCDGLNYRWMFHACETSVTVIVSRGALIRGGTTDFVKVGSLSPYQMLELPSKPQSIAVHTSSFRLAVACVDGHALLFGPKLLSEPLNDVEMHWECQTTWRIEPEMKAPLAWCQTKEDLILMAGGMQVTMWKVVNDSVAVYAHSSFPLKQEQPANLFAATSNGRYVATVATMHSRLIKIWSMKLWQPGQSTPPCAFLGHAKAIKSIEWIQPAMQRDSATLLTMDKCGEMILWREDHNVTTFAFIRTLSFETSSILSHRSMNMRICGSASFVNAQKLKKVALTDNFNIYLSTSTTLTQEVTPSLDDFYGPTMDQKTVGFFFRPGATADTHEGIAYLLERCGLIIALGEKFIPGNIALKKSTSVYLLFGVLESGDVCFWRLECIALLTSSPRSTLLGMFSGLRKLFSTGALVSMQSYKVSDLGHFDVELHIISHPVGDIHRVQLHIHQVLPGTFEIALVANTEVYPSMGPHALIGSFLLPNANVLGFFDRNRTLYCLKDDDLLKLTHPHFELCYVRFPALNSSVVSCANIVSLEFILAATTDHQLLAICGYDYQNKANVLCIDTTDQTLTHLLVLGNRLVGCTKSDRVYLWTLEQTSVCDKTEVHIEALADTLYCAPWKLESKSYLISVAVPCLVSTWRVVEDDIVPLSSFTAGSGQFRALDQRYDGTIAILIEQLDSSMIYVFAPHDSVPICTWKVDAQTQSIAWYHMTFLLCLSQNCHLTLYDGPNPMWTVDIASVERLSPVRMLCQENKIYFNHGSTLTAAVSAPYKSTILPPIVWSPVLMYQLLRRGAFKALRRFLDALVSSIELFEQTCYVNMHTTSRYTAPRLTWTNIMFNPETGQEDLWTPSTRQSSNSMASKDCAAFLFAPRSVSVPKTNSNASKTDYTNFFTPDRLQLLQLPDNVAFSSLVSMLQLTNEDNLEDIPAMKFALAITWREKEYSGLSAEALLWARLSKMDLMSLPVLQAIKWNWAVFRDLRLPFWVEDLSKLKQKTELVAQFEYAATKNPFEVALFYVLLGKTRLLSGLFRLAKENKIADLLANDFTEDRWRTAAIKNAFVLKSKGRHSLSATFFLLGNKIYEAASMAQSADTTLVLSYLICRLSEPPTGYSESDIGPTTTMFLNNIVLSRAQNYNDIYAETLVGMILSKTKKLPIETLLNLPTNEMTCAFQTTNSFYWKQLNLSLDSACALVRYDMGRRFYDESMMRQAATSRLLAQGLMRSAYRCCSDFLDVCDNEELCTSAKTMLEQTKMATICVQLDHLSTQLILAIEQSLSSNLPITDLIKEFERLRDSLQDDLSTFSDISVDAHMKQEVPLVWVCATHILKKKDISVPLADFAQTIMRQKTPWAAVRAAKVWVLYLQYVYTLDIESDPATIRLASTCIYSAICLALSRCAKLIESCCVVRTVNVLFPQKDLSFVPEDQCLTCFTWRQGRAKSKAYASLRQDLPAIYTILNQFVDLQPKWTSLKTPTQSISCSYFHAFLAVVYHTMAQHANRILSIGESSSELLTNAAEHLSEYWCQWSDQSPKLLRSACTCMNDAGPCIWILLSRELVPAVAQIPPAILDMQISNNQGNSPVVAMECIYKSQVPGESIKSMCFNPEQRSTVVFCNGRFIYRSTAKKPRPTESNDGMSTMCQLQVNSRYSPPPAFLTTGEVEAPKLASPLSPQPDSRSSSYRPIAVVAHPELSLFCSGTSKGTVELWRFDNTSAPLGSFDHHVPTTNPLTQLAAPRKDIHRVRFENSGNILGACDNVGFVYLWNFTASGASACYAHLQCHNRGTRDFTFLNASSCLASVGASTKKNNLCLWDTLMPPQKALICAPACHPLGATAVVFSSRHQLLISGGESGSLSVFDVRRQRMLHSISGAHESAINTLVLHPKGHCVLSGTSTGDIKIWSLPLFRELSAFLTGKAKPAVATFLGDTTSAFVAPTISGITDAFATDDFFYLSNSDGTIQRCHVPITSSFL